MTSKIKIGLIGLIVLIALLFVWIFSGSKNQKDSTTSSNNSANAVVYSNWNDSYVLASKQPLGLYHWNAMMQLHLNKGQEIATIDYLYSIDTISEKKKPTFIFIGNHFALFYDEIDAILEEVSNKGANLFIASNKIDENMYHPFFQAKQFGFYYDTSISIATATKNYNFVSKFQSYNTATQWNGFKYYIMQDSLEFNFLSGYGNLLNSGVIEYGKGKVYLNTTPELFTNYQILTKDGFEYSKVWLNEIPKNEPVYWLEMARFEPPVYNYWDEINENKKDDSYLQFIFQNENRIFAMLLLIAGLILFIVFRAKRMQPLVPVLPKKRNMSLIFAETVTSIYFNQRNPFALVKVQKSNFYSIVQKHFHIDLSKEVTEKEIESLSQKSNVSKEEINEILKSFKLLRQYNTSESDLTELRKSILNFYRTAGLISQKVQSKLEAKTYKIYRNPWISGFMIVVGLRLIAYGTFFLADAIAVGVLLWPIGLLPILIGIRRLLRPYIEWSNHELYVTPLFGKVKVYSMKKLISINQSSNSVQFYFENDKLKITYLALNKSDTKQFKHFVETHNKLK